MSEYQVSVAQDNRDRNLVFKKYMNELCKRDGINTEGESNVFEIDEIRSAVLNEFSLDYVLIIRGLLIGIHILLFICTLSQSTHEAIRDPFKYGLEYTTKSMTRIDIKCTENGPNLIVVDGNVFAAMCRCGASNTKPYCDGAHGKTGFKAQAKDIKVSQ